MGVAQRDPNRVDHAPCAPHLGVAADPENADPDVQEDLDRFFARLAPDGDPIYRHTIEGEDDMPAHVRAALTAVNLSIPIIGGALALGTWQGIYLWEHRKHRHTRRIAAHLIGE